MAGSADVIVRFIGDTSRLKGDVAQVEGTGAKLKSWATGVGAAIGAAFAVKAVVDFTNAASDLAESVSKTNVVFGDSAKSVQTWSKNSADAFGLSRQAALEAASTYGNLAVSIGIPQGPAADMSTTLVQLAADLASFNNTSIDDAILALRSGLVGETEPLRKFGVNLSDAALRAEALALGLEVGKGPLDANTKLQASYALIMKQSTTAQGDFARTSGGLANQQRILSARWEDMQATIGNALLPVMLRLVSVALVLVSGLGKLGDALDALVGFVRANVSWLTPLAVAMLVLNANAIVSAISLGVLWVQVTALTVAEKLAAIAQWALNAAMTANPIGLVVAAIALLIAGFILAYQKIGWFHDLVQAVFGWIADNWPKLLMILTGPFGIAVALIVKYWDQIRDAAMAVFNWIRDNWQLLLAILTGPIGIAVGLIVSHFDKIKAAASAVFGWVRDRFNDIVGTITGVADSIGSIVSRIVNALKGPINGVIAGWNAIEFEVPSVEVFGKKIGGMTIGLPDIPKLAHGGIVTAPTLALIGERGPEAVVPLARMGGNTYSIAVTVSPGTDAAQTGRAIVDLIAAYERANGKDWRAP